MNAFPSRHQAGTVPLGRLALYGLALNAVWEFVQCAALYEMRGFSFWRVAAWMGAATLGDGVIILGVVFLAGRLVGPRRLCPPDPGGWLALLSDGIVVGVVLEWAARALHLW
jgi:hypothetical protein